MALIALLVVVVALIARVVSSHGSTPSETKQTAQAMAVVAPSSQPTAPREESRSAQRPRAAKTAAEKPKPMPTPATTTSVRPESAPSLAEVAARTPHSTERPRTDAAPAIPPTPTEVAAQPVTITGCLETTVQENEFRLTDTEGADAPKSRSWKSGFMKKSAAPVSLVELGDPTGLKKLVGRRVTATGLLASGELRVRSVKPAGAACN
jgi:cell pole-organizing protein PopZ